jgi:excisionase family DNA binding protein
MSVPQAARVLGIARNSAYEAVRQGTIPSFRIGRRILVPKRAVEQILTGAGDQMVRRGTAGLSADSGAPQQ